MMGGKGLLFGMAIDLILQPVILRDSGEGQGPATFLPFVYGSDDYLDAFSGL